MTKRGAKCSPLIEDCESGEWVFTAWIEEGCKDMFRDTMLCRKGQAEYTSLNLFPRVSRSPIKFCLGTSLTSGLWILHGRFSVPLLNVSWTQNLPCLTVEIHVCQCLRTSSFQRIRVSFVPWTQVTVYDDGETIFIRLAKLSWEKKTRQAVFSFSAQA